MYCPKCHKEFEDEKNEFCPFCGYRLKDYRKDILAKFDKKHKQYYFVAILLAFIIGASALTLMIVFPKYFLIFLIFPAFSFFLDRFIAKQIGLIDRENTPKEVISYLTKTSIFVQITNLINIGTIIYGIVLFFMNL